MTNVGKGDRQKTTLQMPCKKQRKNWCGTPPPPRQHHFYTYSESFELSSLWYNFALHACAFGIILLSNKFFSKSFGGKRLYVYKFTSYPLSFRCLENDQFQEVVQKKNCHSLEWRQKLMWNTATSPPPPLTSISFILIARVWSTHPCGTVASNTHAY